MILYVVRHGQATHNILETANDITSTPSHLTPKGRAQAADLAKQLRAKQFDVIYTSELVRTVETAAILNAHRDVPVIRDGRINDLRTGMQGKPFEEYRALINAAADRWGTRVNDGESFEDEHARIMSFLDDLRQQSYDKVLIVTHGGVANILYGYQRGYTNEEIFARICDNASIFTIEI